jgi:hypothetical protein
VCQSLTLPCPRESTVLYIQCTGCTVLYTVLNCILTRDMAYAGARREASLRLGPSFTVWVVSGRRFGQLGAYQRGRVVGLCQYQRCRPLPTCAWPQLQGSHQRLCKDFRLGPNVPAIRSRYLGELQSPCKVLALGLLATGPALFAGSLLAIIQQESMSLSNASFCWVCCGGPKGGGTRMWYNSSGVMLEKREAF